MSTRKQPFLYGESTRSLWELFSRSSTEEDMISINVIRPLLNSIGLYPTHSQVHELVHCACEFAGGRKPTDSITFGEFCILVSELREHYRRNIPIRAPRAQLKVKAIQQAYEEKNRKRKLLVFLGGSCNPTTWREDEAIPFFKKNKITVFNPQVSNWKPELIEIEDAAKEMAEILLFVIDNKTRSTSSMVEVAYLSGCGRQIVLVMRNFQRTHQQPVIIHGEKLKQSELEDLENSHRYLVDLVERMSTPVFYELDQALHCAEKVLNNNIKVSELTAEDGAHPIKHPHVRIASELIRMREIFNTLSSGNGRLDNDDLRLAYRTVTDEDLPADVLKRRASLTPVSLSSSAPSLSTSAAPTFTSQQQQPQLNHAPSATAAAAAAEEEDENGFTFDNFCCIVAEHRYRKRAVTERLVTGLVRLPSRLASWLRGYPAAGADVYEEWGGRQWDVFLGGSCGSTRWREDIAIPMLKGSGVSYYNPHMASNWDAHYLALEASVKHSCRLLLFIITSDARAVMSMLEAAYYIGHSCNTVLCVQDLQSGLVINNEPVSETAVSDYNRARAYLSDLANRNGVPVHTDISDAVLCTIDRLRDSSSYNLFLSSSPSSNSSSQPPCNS